MTELRPVDGLRPIDMARNISQKQFEQIMEAFDEISRWVEKNFSEVSFTVEFNDDSQNPVDPSFQIKSRLMTTKAMDLHDQLLRKNTLKIRQQDWDDPIYMQKWIALLVPKFTDTISETINNWYARKKVEGTAQ